LNNTTIVYMANDARPKGGLADRLYGIVTLYKICKLHGFRFKINFTVPFDLSAYLLPRYDWKISEDEIALNKAKSVSVSSFAADAPVPEYADTEEYPELDFDGLCAVIENYSKDYEYILLYTNRKYCAGDYGALFDELFSLSPALRDAVDSHREKLNYEYPAAVFRFQCLLDDFDEHTGGNRFPTLPARLQDAFIQRNINHLIKIHNSNKGKKILVCSDSVRFRNAAAMYDFVYAVGGERQHINIPKMENQYAMLTFIDFFLISYSGTAYLVLDGIKDNGIKYETYNSGFPRVASYLKNVKFILMDYRLFSTKIKRYKSGIMRRLERLIKQFIILCKRTEPHAGKNHS